MIASFGYGLGDYVGSVGSFAFTIFDVGNRPFDHGILPPGGILFERPANFGMIRK